MTAESDVILVGRLGRGKNLTSLDDCECPVVQMISIKNKPIKDVFI